jgi:hypothetical protein
LVLRQLVHDVTAVEPPPDPTLPPEVRRAILQAYGKQYGLRLFVESGTANGDTPAYLAPFFDHLWTIERDGRLFALAVERFMGTNVTPLHGDSGQLLPGLLAQLDRPALFWLDGHRCGGESGPDDTPLLDELAAIFVSPLRHVVLIDDARLLGGMSHYGEWDWPHIDVVRAMAEAAGYTFEMDDDIIRLVPA